MVTKMALSSRSLIVDQNSGFCKSNSIFYSKREPIPLPSNPSLDITSFISSQPHRGDTAFIDSATGRRLSFSELWRAVDSLSTSLSNDMGIKKGDVVLILSPNSIFFPVVCLSVMSLGAVITTTNPLNTSSEIAKQIKDSNPVLAFTTRQLLPKLSGTLPAVLVDGVGERLNSTRVVEESVSHTRGVEFRVTLEEMMRKETSGKRVKERVAQDDTAAVLYSSGTTGVSKGVMITHKNLIALARTYQARFKPDQISVAAIPMFHMFGFAAFATCLIALGFTIVVVPKFEMHGMLSSVDRYGAAFVPLVPPVLVAMVSNADQIKAKYDLRSMRTILCGGAPLSKEVIEEFTKEYPWMTILQGYGLTESTSVASSMFTLEESRRYGTAGQLAPNIEAKIVDPDTGRVLGVNQTGELWLRGPYIMKGYFGNKEATASTIDSAGWLKTGDLCYIDGDGFLFVVDRLKELIKYKGYQVPPAELEALLHTHPQINDAAVIPFPDEKVGQYPMAYVVRKDGSDLSEDAVMDFVGKQVAPYKRIHRVAFVPSIPKTPSGKILRKDLVKLASSKL